MQFISDTRESKRLHKSVKSVIVFSTYDGGESKPYLQCLSQIFQMTNDVHFQFKERRIKA